MSPDKEEVYGLSVGSLSDFNSRAASTDFDTASAFVVNEIDTPKPNDTLSCISDYSVVGAPNVLLKPPCGLEKNVAHDSEQNSAVVELPRRPKAASARQDRSSKVMRLPPPLPRAASAREDQSSVVTTVPLGSQVEGTAHDTIGVATRAGANTSSEIIIAASDCEIVDDGDKENISEAKETSPSANAIEQKNDVSALV